jgi:hypothetical protein
MEISDRWRPTRADFGKAELAEGVSYDPGGASSATSPASLHEIWSGISGRNASRAAADQAEVMTADGYSERSGFEPRIFQIAQMPKMLA